MLDTKNTVSSVIPWEGAETVCRGVPWEELCRFERALPMQTVSGREVKCKTAEVD